MTLSVTDIVGPFCITNEDGQKIYDAIHASVKRKENVVLDFSGIKSYACPFFSSAIGQLLKDSSEETVRSSITVQNLSDGGRLAVKLTMENAARYYHDEDYRNALIKVINDDIYEEN